MGGGGVGPVSWDNSGLVPTKPSEFESTVEVGDPGTGVRGDCVIGWRAFFR